MRVNVHLTNAVVSWAALRFELKRFIPCEILLPIPLLPTKHPRKICLLHNERCASEASNCWLFTIPIHALLPPNHRKLMCGLPTTQQRFTLLWDSAVNNQNSALSVSQRVKEAGNRLSMKSSLTEILETEATRL